MAIAFDDEVNGFVLVPDECPDCEEPRYDTGCPAPGCHGAAFPCCGTGCDWEMDDEGRCARAIAAEDDEDRDERIARERAAFGLTTRPTTQDGENS